MYLHEFYHVLSRKLSICFLNHYTNRTSIFPCKIANRFHDNITFVSDKQCAKRRCALNPDFLVFLLKHMDIHYTVEYSRIVQVRFVVSSCSAEIRSDRVVCPVLCDADARRGGRAPPAWPHCRLCAGGRGCASDWARALRDAAARVVPAGERAAHHCVRRAGRVYAPRVARARQLPGPLRPQCTHRTYSTLYFGSWYILRTSTCCAFFLYLFSAYRYFVLPSR